MCWGCRGNTMIRQIDAVDEPRVVIEVITDPVELDRHRHHVEQARRNEQWLHEHGRELWPQAAGKFLAVAGQQAFLADTPSEALAQARAAHPDDTGSLIQYVRPLKGPRIYAN